MEGSRSPACSSPRSSAALRSATALRARIAGSPRLTIASRRIAVIFFGSTEVGGGAGESPPDGVRHRIGQGDRAVTLQRQQDLAAGVAGGAVELVPVLDGLGVHGTVVRLVQQPHAVHVL